MSAPTSTGAGIQSTMVSTATTASMVVATEMVVPAGSSLSLILLSLTSKKS